MSTKTKQLNDNTISHPVKDAKRSRDSNVLRPGTRLKPRKQKWRRKHGELKGLYDSCKCCMEVYTHMGFMQAAAAKIADNQDRTTFRQNQMV